MLSVHCGAFEPETHWREKDLATLPSVPDPRSARVIEAMDELLFVFCRPGDKLLTARRMNEAHVRYLNTLGFDFLPSTFDVCPAGQSHGRSATNLFSAIAEQSDDRPLAAFIRSAVHLKPFAIVPGVIELAQRYGMDSQFPSQEIIRWVNTKSYSLHVRDVLGLPNVGISVEDTQAFQEHGSRLLARGPYLVKDDYGVSGKGNQIVTQASTIDRLADYLRRQEKEGKHIRFVLEPLLPKKLDLSCQFHLSRDGLFRFISVQHLVNEGLAFGMSCSPTSDLLATLEGAGYFPLMEQVAKELYSEGYFGDVCVDSMLLKDGTLSPLVEINARKSMSLIKHEMDIYLNARSQSGILTSITASHDGVMSFGNLLDLLHEHELLFEPDRDVGILPLSATTLFPASTSPEERNVRGRIYVEAVSVTPEQRLSLLASLASEMRRNGFRVRE